MAVELSWPMSRLRIAVATVVTVLWAAVVSYATFIDTATTSTAQLVTPVMLAVVGWLFAGEYLRRRNGTSGTGNRDDPS